MSPFCLFCNEGTIHIGNFCYKRTKDNCYINFIGEEDCIENKTRNYEKDI